MATIETRHLVDGEINYYVRWIVGGGRRRAGARHGMATFEHENDAKRFQMDLEENGQLWPKGWQKDPYGYTVRVEQLLPRHATFADVAERYFEISDRAAHAAQIEAKTVDKYREIYEGHLEATFGSRDFAAIEVEDIEEWITNQLEVPLAGKTVLNQFSVLRPIFKVGIGRMKLRADNPCDYVANKPKKSAGKKKQVKFFTHEEWFAMFRPHLEADVLLLVDLKLATGMRWQEIAALRVGDCQINDDGTVSIHIQQAWTTRGKKERRAIDLSRGENAKWMLKGTKSDKEHWVLVEDEETCDGLREQIAERGAERYVFTTQSDLPWRYDDFMRDRWDQARTKAVAAGLVRINPTPHMLRHSFVVWALNGGEDIHKVSAAIGHASIQVTNDIYGGFIDPKRLSVARTIAQQMAMGRKLTPLSLEAAAARRARDGVGHDDGDLAGDGLLTSLDDRRQVSG